MIVANKIIIARTNTILNKLEKAINDKQPFGLVRFGDGTIKAIHSFLSNDLEQLKQISEQEGIPIRYFNEIIEFWRTSANLCDYIDTPEVYFSGKFWERTKKHDKKKISVKTLERLMMWKQLYVKIGITNGIYCNPEINFLSCLQSNKTSLPKLIEGRKICCISSRFDIRNKFKDFCDIEVVRIPGKNENQFSTFSKIIKKIDTDSDKFDLWLVAAGELGRMYPGLIKFRNGRAFDVGSLIDFWCTGEIPSRLLPYMTTVEDNSFNLELTKDGKKFLRYI